MRRLISNLEGGKNKTKFKKVFRVQAMTQSKNKKKKDKKTVASKYDNRQPFDMAGFKFDSVNVPDRSMHSRGKTEDE